MPPKGTRTGADVACRACGEGFYAYPSDLKHGRGVYCSKACMATGYTGQRRPLDDRFWAKVDASTEDGCWPWLGSIYSQTGYGCFNHEGHGQGAHRVAWVLASGAPIPKGLHVLHACDHRPCVRNDEPGIYVIRGIARPRFGHLWLGTHADNMADMADKGRSGYTVHPEACLRGDRHPVHLRPELVRGMNNGQAKLTDDDVREIRRRYVPRIVTTTALAQEYGVAQALIWRIIHRKVWTHIA